MGNRTSQTNLSFYLVRTKEEAELLLQQAEQADFYREECSDDRANAAARHYLTYAPRVITPEEGEKYQTHLNQIITRLPSRLRTDLQRVTVVPLMPSADGGMPHTRPTQLLCVPRLELLESHTTVCHELWHIHQRMYGMEWMKVFHGLGWKLWSGHLPVSLEENRRINPDTIDAPLWIYQNRWVPVPIFRDIQTPILSDVDIWFYDIINKHHIRQIPADLSNEFPSLPAAAYEHPRELTAYLLAEPDRYREFSGFKKLLSLIGQVSII